MAGAAETAKLLASLELDTRKFTAGAKTATTTLGGLEKSLGNLGRNVQQGVSTAAANIAKLGAVAAVGLAGAIGAGVRSLAELSQVQAQTAAVIASTGGAAGVTATQVRDLANRLEDITTVDDKVIQGGENLLLTFTNIGAKAFPQATKAIVDMAIAMNNGSAENLDLSKTAIQVGKALNDPIAGITALKKVGVSFTAEQKKQISELVKSGKVYEAQQVILKELETEFGKAGEAAGKDFGSDMRRVKDALEEASQALATGFLPLITTASRFLKEKLTDPNTIAAIKGFGDDLAAGGQKLLDFLAKVDFGKVIEAAGAIKDAGAGLVQAFVALPEDVKTILLAFAGISKLTGGAPIKIGVDFVKGAFDQIFAKGSTPVNPLYVKDISGGLGGNAPGSQLPGGPGLLVTIGAVAAGVTFGVKVTEDTNSIFKTLIDRFGGNVPPEFRATGNPLEDIPKLVELLTKQPDGTSGEPITINPQGGSFDRYFEPLDTQAKIQALLQRDANTILRASLTRPMPAPITNITTRVDVNISGQDVTSVTLRDRLASNGIISVPGGMRIV